MKKFLLFPLLVFMTAIIIPACSDDEEDIFSPETSDTIINGGDTINNEQQSRIFNGTLVVNESYAQDSINCEVIFDKENLILNIFSVKFAAAMPMSISLSVPGIPYEGDSENIIFGGDSIVPLMGVAPVPQFMFNRIDGSIQPHALNFSAEISGRGTIAFSGTE